MKKSPALFVSPTNSVFMKIDKDILAARHDLDFVNLYQERSKFTYLIQIIKAVFMILRQANKYKSVYVWFGDYHAFPIALLCKAMGIKCCIFVGGYDAVHYPDMAMGAAHTAIRRFCNKNSLALASLIIANHSALIKSINLYYHNHPDGILNLYPHLKTPSEVVYNAIPLFPEAKPNAVRKPLSILSVGSTPRYMDCINKGYDLLLQIAREHPEWQFTIVGIRRHWWERLLSENHASACQNVQMIDKLPHAKLYELYTSNHVYVQASISEGMPNALMEAIALGCVPVGSNVSGIPTLMDSYGVLVKKRDVRELESAIDAALRQSIDIDRLTVFRNKFSYNTRKASISSVLDKYEF